MSYSVRAVANYFLDKGEEEGIPIDPIKLQKLVYYAHAWHLVAMEEPLINQRFEAWKYGPVVSTLYHDFKQFGSNPIEREKLSKESRDLDKLPDSAKDAKALIDRVWQKFRGYSGMELSALTHARDSPWEKAWQRAQGRESFAIPDQSIKKYFDSRLERVEQAA